VLLFGNIDLQTRTCTV